MENLPILSIMALFMGAFLNSLVGRRSRAAGNAVVLIAMGAAFCMMAALVPAVFFGGQTICYWLGGWAPDGGWAYGIGLEVDALSLFFGLIVTIAVLVSGIYSFTYMKEDDSQVNFYTLFLMLSGSVLGLVLSGDLFNVFVMVEIMTFSAVALTAFRNEYEGALEGAFKYLVVGSIGSTCILVGTILVYANLHTLNMAQIAALAPANMNMTMVAAFAFLFVGFATKAFLFPFQPLAADAHAVAPASISLMISGVLTKCGVYGIIRLCYGLFQNMDERSVGYLVTGFGMVTMFICVTMAFNQHNFKRLLAFHSISQVGYVITAIGAGTAMGLSAGLFHAVNHTLFKGLLFLVAGAVQHQSGSLDLDDLGGLSKNMPRTTVLFLIGAASISGLPPFNGFASKWMIYQALFEKAAQSGDFFYVLACLTALITSVLTLASFIKVAQSVFFGQRRAKYAQVKESPLGMRLPMWVLAALCALLGIFYRAFAAGFLNPAAGAALGVDAYIANALTGESVLTEPVSYWAIGSWNPLVWLILLVLATCAVALVSVTNKPRVREACAEGSVSQSAESVVPVTMDGVPAGGSASESVPPEEAKYEPFFSGEESEYSQVGGSDLFWGFKENCRKYFAFWHKWHSGVVNDYALYAVVCLAAVLLYCAAFVK
ncbi:MAG: proton-conducting transporter membrane subunit [Eubacteriales bacterium]|nr:proton-conducting transporter membrane subunit [Eubacteriales bacterium]